MKTGAILIPVILGHVANSCAWEKSHPKSCLVEETIADEEKS